MKNCLLQFLILIMLLVLFKTMEQEYYMNADEFFNHFENLKFTESQYKEIIGNISKIFSDSYAFNDISKNPPQPFQNYHMKVDIQERLNQIDLQNINVYEFYRRISNIFADLKDTHIRMFFKYYNFENYFIVGPFEYYVKDYNNGTQRIIAKCIDEDILDYFDVEDELNIKEFCHDEIIIKSINGIDPFEYINNFGGNYLSSKNVHGTFSFKINFHNYVSLNDFPLSQDELNNLIIILDDGTEIKTKYLIQTTYDDENSFMRSLKTKTEFSSKYHNRNKKLKNNKNFNFEKNKNLRGLSTYISWNFNAEEMFKCYADEENKINFYYINSFAPEDRQKYIETIINCVDLFDENDYPIVVVSEFNDGGYISLSQFFLGLLSPLIPINLYKGRLRITDAIQKNDELVEYITSNLTNINNCKKADYDDLINKKVKTNYSDTYLTEIFYISNMTIHNKIEEYRGRMKNKRKPTEILVLTDGYSFSAAGLFVKYLQKMGGAIVAGYFGNPHNSEIFDSSQSPSGVFTSDILNIFNKKETAFLQSYYILLEIPGIQTFYDLNDKNVPLEYEITPVDIRLNVYSQFNDESYTYFIEELFSIFDNIKSKCFNNLIKFSDECIFKNNYTHGGYSCNEDGSWSDICVPSYCEPGYSFDKTKNKCIKDICSSISVPDIEDEEEEDNKEEEEDNEEDDGKKEDEGSDNSTILYVTIFTIIGIIVIFIVVFSVIHCSKKKLSSSSIDFSK